MARSYASGPIPSCPHHKPHPPTLWMDIATLASGSSTSRSLVLKPSHVHMSSRGPITLSCVCVCACEQFCASVCCVLNGMPLCQKHSFKWPFSPRPSRSSSSSPSCIDSELCGCLKAANQQPYAVKAALPDQNPSAFWDLLYTFFCVCVFFLSFCCCWFFFSLYCCVLSVVVSLFWTSQADLCTCKFSPECTLLCCLVFCLFLWSNQRLLEPVVLCLLRTREHEQTRSSTFSEVFQQTNLGKKKLRSRAADNTQTDVFAFYAVALCEMLSLSVLGEK